RLVGLSTLSPILLPATTFALAVPNSLLVSSSLRLVAPAPPLFCFGGSSSPSIQHHCFVHLPLLSPTSLTPFAVASPTTLSCVASVISIADCSTNSSPLHPIAPDCSSASQIVLKSQQAPSEVSSTSRSMGFRKIPSSSFASGHPDQPNPFAHVLSAETGKDHQFVVFTLFIISSSLPSLCPFSQDHAPSLSIYLGGT
ncbi:hypothetical protein PCASD_11456, partial [Puccinia coronata f. sp. avenae]